MFNRPVPVEDLPEEIVTSKQNILSEEDVIRNLGTSDPVPQEDLPDDFIPDVKEVPVESMPQWKYGMPEETIVEEPSIMPSEEIQKPLTGLQGTSTLGITHPEQEKAGAILRNELERQNRLKTISQAMEKQPEFYKGLTKEDVLTRQIEAEKTGAMGEVQPSAVDPIEWTAFILGGGIPGIVKTGMTAGVRAAASKAISNALTATAVGIAQYPIGQATESLAQTEFAKNTPGLPLAFNFIANAATIYGIDRAIRSLQLSDTWRKMTIPERGIVVQTIDQLKKAQPYGKFKGFTEGELARMSPEAYQESFAKRMPAETPIESQVTPEAVSGQFKGPLATMYETRISQYEAKGDMPEIAKAKAFNDVANTIEGKIQIRKATESIIQQAEQAQLKEQEVLAKEQGKAFVPAEDIPEVREVIAQGEGIVESQPVPVEDIPEGYALTPTEEIEKPVKATQKDLFGVPEDILTQPLPSKEITEELPLEKATKEAEERKFIEERQIEIPEGKGVNLRLDFPIPKRTQDAIKSVSVDKDISTIVKNLGLKKVIISPPYTFELSQQGAVTKYGEIRLNPDATDLRQTFLHELGHILWDNLNKNDRQLLHDTVNKNKMELSKTMPGYIEEFKRGHPEEAMADFISNIKDLPEDLKNIILKRPEKLKEYEKGESSVIKTEPKGTIIESWEDINKVGGFLTSQHDIEGIIKKYGDKPLSIKDVNGGRHRMMASDVAKVVDDPVANGYIRGISIHPFLSEKHKAGQLKELFELDPDTLKSLPSMVKAFARIFPDRLSKFPKELKEIISTETRKFIEKTQLKIPHQPQNIITWIKSKGGIDYLKEEWNGEIDTAIENQPTLMRAVNMKGGGLTLDELAMMAQAEGWIKEATPQNLLNAIESKKIRPDIIEKRTIKELEERSEANLLYSGIPVDETIKQIKKGIDILGRKTGVKLDPKVNSLVQDDINILNKYINTPLFISKKHPQFKPIFESAFKISQDRNDMITDMLSHEQKYFDLNKTDKSKVDEVLEKGTLEEKVYSNDELAKMGLTENQKKGYWAERNKYKKALKILEDFYKELGANEEQMRLFKEEVGRLRGYIPLSRFGEWAVTIKTPGQENTFMMFENKFTAQREANRIVKETPNAQVSIDKIARLPKSDILQGLDSGTILLLAKMADINPSIADPFIQQVREFMKTRGFKKHFIHRQKTPGYSKDWTRVHSDYTVSLSNYIARMRGIKAMKETMKDIDPTKQPELYKYADKYISYMEHPGEEAAKLRSFLFLYYLGANPKSATLNLTQTITTTIPYLGQFKAFPTADILRAINNVRSAVTIKEGRPYFDHAKLGPTGEALKKAEGTGIVNEQMVYELMAKSRGEQLTTEKHRITRALAYMFGTAETFNRRVAFLSAYDIGKKLEASGKLPDSVKDAQGFAEKAVADTQFLYGRFNRPTIARGKFGATFFTFKSFMLQYMELLSSLARANGENIRPGQFMKALGIMITLAGITGLPFVDDIKKLYEKMSGENLDVKARDIANDYIGDPQVGEVIMKGVTRLGPLDMSNAIGIGDVIPETETISLLGPAGGVLQRLYRTKPYLAREEYLRALETVSPEAIRNPLAAARLYTEGQRNVRGELIFGGEGRWKKEVNVAGKALGFQPSDLARAYEREQAQFMIGGKRGQKKVAFIDRIGKAIAEENEKEIDRIWDEVEKYNEGKKLDSQIIITPQNIRDSVRKRISEEDVSGLRKTPKQARPEYQRLQELFK